MILIIDAYNYLKSVHARKHISESDQQQSTDMFVEYAHKRGNQVILVFDAGPGYYKMTERFGDVTVIYSGHTQSADEVIKELLKKYVGKDLLLVTSDRDICHYADRLSVVSIGSQDFEKVFKQVMRSHEEYEHKVAQTLHKTSDDQNNELDQLMEVGSRDLVADQVAVDNQMVVQVRGGKKAGKADRRLMRKVEKI